MKLLVLHDKDGRIIAAARRDGDSPVRVRPMADDQAGHRIAEVYVPAEYAHYDLAAVCQRMTVDVKGPFAELKAT